MGFMTFWCLTARGFLSNPDKKKEVFINGTITMGFLVAKFHKNRMGSRLGRSSSGLVSCLFHAENSCFFQGFS